LIGFGDALPYWAATQLEPHRERVAQYFLQQFGFEVYLPSVRRYQMRWRRRRRISPAGEIW